MGTYEVTKTVEFTFIVEAEDEDEAEAMAWDYDEQRERLNGVPHSCSNYCVYEITVEDITEDE